MSSLRTRLIASHTLPTLLLVPLIGFVLIYLLETQVILPISAQQLKRQAMLLQMVAADFPAIWADPAAAQAFVARFSPALTAHFRLLTADGRLLAASNPEAQPSPEERLPPLLVTASANAEGLVETNYSLTLRTEVIDVWMPVYNEQGMLLGVVRLTHLYATVYERFQRSRLLILQILAVGLLAGIGAGLYLALNLERPVVQLTRAIQRFVLGEEKRPLTEEGTTEMRALIRSFNRLVEQLQQQETVRKRLLANVIHEIRRPLGALSSATHALRHGASEHETLRTELLKGMESEFRHVQQLMNDLLLLYEQAIGDIALDRQPTDLYEWLTTSLVHWRSAARQKGLEWRMEIPETLPTWVIDPARLGQALGNLVSNALKFTPTPGVVTIAAGATDDGFWISVTDSGPGIDPQEQQQIFEPFFRSHAHQRFPEGIGLGLTIARDLVQAHGGRLTANSLPGGGSQFLLQIPRPRTDERHPPLSTPALHAGAGNPPPQTRN